jgi:hypothetical protein
METGLGLHREHLARRLHHSGALPTKNHRRLSPRSAAGQFAARSVLQRTNSKESNTVALCRGPRGSGGHRRSCIHVGFWRITMAIAPHNFRQTSYKPSGIISALTLTNVLINHEPYRSIWIGQNQTGGRSKLPIPTKGESKRITYLDNGPFHP